MLNGLHIEHLLVAKKDFAISVNHGAYVLTFLPNCHAHIEAVLRIAEHSEGNISKRVPEKRMKATAEHMEIRLDTLKRYWGKLYKDENQFKKRRKDGKHKFQNNFFTATRGGVELSPSELAELGCVLFDYQKGHFTIGIPEETVLETAELLPLGRTSIWPPDTREHKSCFPQVLIAKKSVGRRLLWSFFAISCVAVITGVFGYFYSKINGNAETEYQAAKRLNDEEDFTGAEQSLRELVKPAFLKRDYHCVKAWELLCRAQNPPAVHGLRYVRRKKLEHSLNDINAAINKYGAEPLLLLGKARLLYLLRGKSNWEQAMEIYSKCLEQIPNPPAIHFSNYASCYSRLGSNEDALRILRQRILVAPRDWIAQCILAELLAKLEYYDELKGHSPKFKDLPVNVWVWGQRLWNAFHLKQYQECIDLFKIRKDEFAHDWRYADALLAVGRAYWELGNKEMALRAFTDICDMDDECAAYTKSHALGNLGYIHRQLGELTKARESYLAALQVSSPEPDFSIHTLNAAKLLLPHSDADVGRLILTAAERCSQRSTEVLTCIGLVRINQGKYGESLELLQSALIEAKGDDRRREIHGLMATAYAFLNDLDSCIDQCKASLAVDSNAADIKAAIHIIYSQCGRRTPELLLFAKRLGHDCDPLYLLNMLFVVAVRRLKPGQFGFDEAMVRELRRAWTNDHIYAGSYLALAHAERGNKGRCLQIVEALKEKGEIGIAESTKLVVEALFGDRDAISKAENEKKWIELSENTIRSTLDAQLHDATGVSVPRALIASRLFNDFIQSTTYQLSFDDMKKLARQIERNEHMPLHIIDHIRSFRRNVLAVADRKQFSVALTRFLRDRKSFAEMLETNTVRTLEKFLNTSLLYLPKQNKPDSYYARKLVAEAFKCFMVSDDLPVWDPLRGHPEALDGIWQTYPKATTKCLIGVFSSKSKKEKLSAFELSNHLIELSILNCTAELKFTWTRLLSEEDVDVRLWASKMLGKHKQTKIHGSDSSVNKVEKMPIEPRTTNTGAK